MHVGDLREAGRSVGEVQPDEIARAAPGRGVESHTADTLRRGARAGHVADVTGRVRGVVVADPRCGRGREEAGVARTDELQRRIRVDGAAIGLVLALPLAMAYALFEPWLPALRAQWVVMALLLLWWGGWLTTARRYRLGGVP